MTYINPYPWGAPNGGSCPTCGRCPTCGQGGGGTHLGGLPPWMQMPDPTQYDTIAPTTGHPPPETTHTTCSVSADNLFILEN